MTSLVLLTGASGFVGRQVLSALSANGVKVRLVLRKKQLLSELAIPAAESIRYSPNIFQESLEWWKTTCEGVDMVIHCAWYAEPGKYLHSSLNLDCLIGTLNFAKAAALAGVRRFVGIGTCFEYDLSCGRLSIETPLLPKSPYAAAKVAAYTALSQWASISNLEFAWCRLFYLFGENEDQRRLVSHLHAQLKQNLPVQLTSGTQIRDFLDVKLAGQKIVEVALSKHVGPKNICSGAPITVRSLAESIADKYGRRDLLLFGARKDDPNDPKMVVGVV